MSRLRREAERMARLVASWPDGMQLAKPKEVGGVTDFRYDEAAIRRAMKDAATHRGDPAGALTEAGLHPFADEALLALAQGTGANVLNALQAAIAEGLDEDELAVRAEQATTAAIIALATRVLLVGVALAQEQR